MESFLCVPDGGHDFEFGFGEDDFFYWFHISCISFFVQFIIRLTGGFVKKEIW